MHTFQLSFDSLNNYNLVTQKKCITYNLPNSLKKITKIHLKSIEFPTNMCTNVVKNVTDEIYFTYNNSISSMRDWIGQSAYGKIYPDGKMWLTLEQQNYSNVLYLLTDLNWYSTHYLKTNLVYDVDINGLICVLLHYEPSTHVIQGCLDYFNKCKYYIDFSNGPLSAYPIFQKMPDTNIELIQSSSLFFNIVNNAGFSYDYTISNLLVDITSTDLRSIVNSLNSQIDDFINGGLSTSFKIGFILRDETHCDIVLKTTDLSSTGTASFSVKGPLIKFFSLNVFTTQTTETDTDSGNFVIRIQSTRNILPFIADPIVIDFNPTGLSNILGFKRVAVHANSTYAEDFTYFDIATSQIKMIESICINRANLKNSLFYNSFFTMYIKGYGISNSGDGSNSSFKIINPYSNIQTSPSLIVSIPPYIQMNDETSTKQFIKCDPNTPIQKFEIYFYDRLGNNIFSEQVPSDVSMTLQFDSYE